MKKLSLTLFFGIVVLFVYALLFMPVANYFPQKNIEFIYPQDVSDTVISLEALSAVINDNTTSDLAPKEQNKVIIAVDKHNQKISAERNAAESAISKRVSQEIETTHSYMPLIKLIIKFLFSLMFGGAALYVVLSQKYDGDTQKWAFSVLSLISGVWIGTVT